MRAQFQECCLAIALLLLKNAQKGNECFGVSFQQGGKKKCASIIWRVLALFPAALLSCHMFFQLSVELEEMPTLPSLLNASAFKGGGCCRVWSATAWAGASEAQKEPTLVALW